MSCRICRGQRPWSCRGCLPAGKRGFSPLSVTAGVWDVLFLTNSSRGPEGLVGPGRAVQASAACCALCSLAARCRGAPQPCLGPAQAARPWQLCPAESWPGSPPGYRNKTFRRMEPSWGFCSTWRQKPGSQPLYSTQAFWHLVSLCSVLSFLLLLCPSSSINIACCLLIRYINSIFIGHLRLIWMFNITS